MLLTARDEVSAFRVGGETGDGVQMSHHRVDNFSCFDAQHELIYLHSATLCRYLTLLYTPDLLSRKRMVRFSCAVMETGSVG